MLHHRWDNHPSVSAQIKVKIQSNWCALAQKLHWSSSQQEEKFFFWYQLSSYRETGMHWQPLHLSLSLSPPINHYKLFRNDPVVDDNTYFSSSALVPLFVILILGSLKAPFWAPYKARTANPEQ